MNWFDDNFRTRVFFRRLDLCSLALRRFGICLTLASIGLLNVMNEYGRSVASETKTNTQRDAQSASRDLARLAG